MKKCLYCYKIMEGGQGDFHPACSRKFFGTTSAPQFDYHSEELEALAAQIIQSQTSLTGVQPKLSLNLNKHERGSRLTIVGLWGDFIFKPQAESYHELPENEDLTMHMAEAARIKVVPHSLIRLSDGTLGYITRRIDRTKTGGKIDMEDMCQLTLHPTEYKYKSSYEQVAKAIVSFSSTPQLDIINFMQILLFSFVTGNNDMHLKNFSLYRPRNLYQLSPAYDLLNATIANPRDKDELALTLNGKKSRLKLSDFLQASATMGIDKRITLRLIDNMKKALPAWQQLINISFLSDEAKLAYIKLVNERMAVLST